MTPVMLLTDGYIANAAEPWKVPDLESYKPFPVEFMDVPPEGGFKPYGRDEKLKRPWVKPGTPGLMHRIGGIEKELDTGHINYSPANHQAMTDIRKAKVDGVADTSPTRLSNSAAPGAKLVRRRLGLDLMARSTRPFAQQRAQGVDVAHIHIRHIWPMPKNLGEMLKSFDRVIVPEMNTGQLKTLLRDQFLVDARPLNKVSGQPFTHCRNRSRHRGGAEHERHDPHQNDHPQGLGNRSGSPLVPRLRRLCDIEGGAAHHA